MKNCINCQKELHDDQRICPYCGEQQAPLPQKEAAPIHDNQAAEKAKALVGEAWKEALNYFGYVRQHWLANRDQPAYLLPGIATLFLFVLFRSLTQTRLSFYFGFVGFLKYFGILTLGILLIAALSWVIRQKAEGARLNFVDFLKDFLSYLILPMLLSVVVMLLSFILGPKIFLNHLSLFCELLVAVAAFSAVTRLRGEDNRLHYLTMVVMAAAIYVILWLMAALR